MKTFSRALCALLLLLEVPGLAIADDKGARLVVDDKQTQLNKELGLACSLGRLERVKELLAQGADLGYCNPADNGKTALVRAVLGGRMEVVRYLLDHGADIHAPDGSGRYPIYFCCISNNIELLQFLIAKGGGEDINRGPFPMLVSLCDHGQAPAAFIPVIVAAGAEPNAYKANVTALIAAIQLDPKVRKPEIARSYVKALIESKVDVNLPDKREKLSPLGWAKRRGDADIIALLEAAGAKENP
jgi:ankyrin repeat protein